MKTIGLIGGMNWKSTSLYYQIINETVQEKLGALHSAKILLYSYDFEEIAQLQNQESWEEWENNLSEKAILLEKAGADFIVMCCNTAHKAADSIQQKLSVSLLHIADPVGKKIIEKKLNKVGLLGTNFTMEEDFYKNRLRTGFGLSVIVPDKLDRDSIHKIIFEELELGIIKKESRKVFIRIIHELMREGAQGIILGCTEISLLIKQEDVGVPVFDTISLHAAYACEKALE